MSSLTPATRPASNPFESLPDELLLFIFKHLSPFQRALLLSTCKHWNQFLLFNTQLWNTLTIPRDLPLDLILTILKAFSSRSNFNLKEVVIETLIDNQEDLNLIFQELKKSAGTLKDLCIAQCKELNGTTRKMAMQYLPMLEGLLTKGQLELFQELKTYLSVFRRKYDYSVSTSDKVGLKLYSTDALLDIDEEDLAWLSEVIYLVPGEVDDPLSLYKLLQATWQLIELDLVMTDWLLDELLWDASILDFLSNPSLEKLCLKNIREIYIPYRSSPLSIFKQWVWIDGVQTLIAGTIHSLISFKVDSLKNLYILLYPDAFFKENDDSDGMKVNKGLVEQNTMVETLTLDCPGASDCSTGAQLHLNETLEMLKSSIDLEREKLGIVGTGENGCPKEAGFLILPHLVKLTIKNPVKLDGDLLRRVIKERTERNKSFKLEFIEGPHEDVVSIEDWEARGWM